MKESHTQYLECITRQREARNWRGIFLAKNLIKKFKLKQNKCIL